MHRLIIPFARLFVILAIAVAMTGSGFGHRVAASEADESLLAYVAAGGALDDLCGQGGFGAGGYDTCDACRLMDGAVVPVSGTAGLPAINASLLQGQIIAAVAPTAQVINLSCPVRAPPVV
ncbi:hypothetical protein BC777_1332 [Yoonia maricola]|uniref:Uncharacterized protein n=1 Tax=Yoonia maricola TaxID=420999 RepID=A0A2M8WNH7_9RHOB|nr:hypothetical protein [Yoonia maricola]PJI92480.1 hypothetical protein BC777_1332 [Yoonia maricola]